MNDFSNSSFGKLFCPRLAVLNIHKFYILKHRQACYDALQDLILAAEAICNIFLSFFYFLDLQNFKPSAPNYFMLTSVSNRMWEDL